MTRSDRHDVTSGTSDAVRSVSERNAGLMGITEMARESGVSVSDLRNWEARYGIPSPKRSQSGRRLYTSSDKETVLRVLALRDAGLSLAGAISQTLKAAALGGGGDPSEVSLFATLRRSNPDLSVHVLDKRTLLALTRAIEDCCFAAAQRPILLGAFQDHRFYRSSQSRWRDMARSSLCAMTFAAAPTPGPQSSNGEADETIVNISLAAGSPLRREWALICDGVERPACVVGWERPGQEARPDPARVFETIWSVDPSVVRQASRVAWSIAARNQPDVRAIDDILAETTLPAARMDALHVSELLGRTLEYLAAAA